MNARGLLPDGPIDWIARDFNLGNPDPRHDERVRAFARAIAEEVHARLPGLAIDQEPKYTVSGSAIVNRASGLPIPADEPVFIFRARDLYARDAITHYLAEILQRNGSDRHVDAVLGRLRDFKRFADTHNRRMKHPDTEPAVRVASPEVSARVDAALDMEELPPIRVSRAVFAALVEQSTQAGVVIQAHVRDLLTKATEVQHPAMCDADRIAELEEEVAVSDKLLSAQYTVMDAIPGCTEHGNRCVPGEIEWVSAVKTRLEDVTAALRAYHHALDKRRHAGNAAMDMVTAIESALGTPWKQGTTLIEGGN